MGFVNKLIYDLEEKIHMYKYFISFTYSSYEKGGYGNVIIEADHKISDFNNTDDMQKWVIDLQRWIESNANIKNVIIMNFKLINLNLEFRRKTKWQNLLKRASVQDAVRFVKATELHMT